MKKEQKKSKKIESEALNLREKTSKNEKEILKEQEEPSKNHSFLKLFLLLFGSFSIIEMIFQWITFHTILEKSFLRILLFDAVMSLVTAFWLSFLKPKLSKWILLFLVFVSATYNIAQLGFYNFMGNYMSLNNATDQGGKVVDYVVEFIRYIKPIYYLCYLPVVFLLILYFFQKDFLKKERWNAKNLVIVLTTTIFLHILSLSTLTIPWFQNENQIKTNKELYKAPTLIELSLKQFGTNRFLWRDFIYMVFPSGKDSTIDLEQTSDNTDTSTTEDPEEKNYERTLDDSLWKEKASEETNDTMKSLDSYFLSQNITEKNEMTGVFEGKNLILIMVEAFDLSAINETVAPTLYKMANEGWYFDNYYTPKYSCTTGESEFIGLTSIIPLASVCTPNSYKNNDYSRSIFQLFNKQGYLSTSYHNWTDEFYERKTIHKNMGSSYFYNHDDLNISPVYGWPSDLELFEEAIPHFIDEDNFMSFIITSSTHFPYDIDSTVVNKNWNVVKNLPYSTKMKRYLAKINELDQGLEYLLNVLEEKGILDDTVIAIFGDHHPLKMSLSDLNSASSIDRFEDFNEDKLPFIIYNHGSEKKTVSKTMSTFDILPTLANLFNLDYDPRSYVGKDVFSNEETTVIFTNGSWITDKAMYFASTGTYKALVEDLEDDYIQKTNQKVKNYFTVSEEVLKKNYWHYR